MINYGTTTYSSENYGTHGSSYATSWSFTSTFSYNLSDTYAAGSHYYTGYATGSVMFNGGTTTQSTVDTLGVTRGSSSSFSSYTVIEGQSHGSTTSFTGTFSPIFSATVFSISGSLYSSSSMSFVSGPTSWSSRAEGLHDGTTSSTSASGTYANEIDMPTTVSSSFTFADSTAASTSSYTYEDTSYSGPDEDISYTTAVTVTETYFVTVAATATERVIDFTTLTFSDGLRRVEGNVFIKENGDRAFAPSFQSANAIGTWPIASLSEFSSTSFSTVAAGQTSAVPQIASSDVGTGYSTYVFSAATTTSSTITLQTSAGSGATRTAFFLDAQLSIAFSYTYALESARSSSTTVGAFTTSTQSALYQSWATTSGISVHKYTAYGTVVLPVNDGSGSYSQMTVHSSYSTSTTWTMVTTFDYLSTGSGSTSSSMISASIGPGSSAGTTNHYTTTASLVNEQTNYFWSSAFSSTTQKANSVAFYSTFCPAPLYLDGVSSARYSRISLAGASQFVSVVTAYSERDWGYAPIFQTSTQSFVTGATSATFRFVASASRFEITTASTTSTGSATASVAGVGNRSEVLVSTIAAAVVAGGTVTAAIPAGLFMMTRSDSTGGVTETTTAFSQPTTSAVSVGSFLNLHPLTWIEAPKSRKIDAYPGYQPITCNSSSLLA